MSPKTCMRTHGDFARGHGDLREELGHVGQKPFERGRGNRRPNQPLDDGGIGGVKGMQIGVGFPFFKQQFYLPPPFVSPTDHLEGVSFGWQVGQERAEALGARVPADNQPQVQGVAVDLPSHPELDPLAFRQFGVDSLEGLVAQRAQAFTVLAKRLDDLRIHPRFGPDEKEAILVLHTTQIV